MRPCLLLVVAAACTSTSTTGGPHGGTTGSLPGDVDTIGDTDGSPGDFFEAVGPAWLRGEYPKVLAKETHVYGAAAHADAEEAQARAELALARVLWGPVAERPAYRPLPPAFTQAEDTLTQEPMDDGRTAVWVAVERAKFATRVEDWLDDAAADMLPTGVPDEPQPRIAAALTRMKNHALELFGCERRKIISRQECDAPNTGDSPLRIAATLVQLRPALEGGIPRFKGELPLRPAGVELAWQKQDGSTVPWPGMRLLFSAPDGILNAAAATTDHNGHAEVAYAQTPTDDLVVTVRIDTAVFGEFAGHWPGVAADLELRVVTATNARVAVHLFEHVSQEPSDERAATTAVVKQLRALGYDNAHALPEALEPTLEDAKAGEFTIAVQKLAAAANGQADVIVLGEVHSDFLSRAVGRSVWHEATAHIKVYDVWTGRHLDDTDRQTRARGIGDINAARNAMKELGTNIGDALHQVFSKGKPTAGEASTHNLRATPG